MRAAGYVAIAVVLAAFGYLAVFSVGFPFLLTGLLMLALIRVRRRRDVMVPVLVWPWVFTVGYVLVAPLGCTSSASASSGSTVSEGVTRCSAAFFSYAGSSMYAPPLWPALLAGAGLATVVSLLLRLLLSRGRSLTPAQ